MGWLMGERKTDLANAPTTAKIPNYSETYRPDFAQLQKGIGSGSDHTVT